MIDEQEIKEDFQFLMNAMSAQNVILRALLRANPEVVTQLNWFLDQDKPQGENHELVYEEIRKILPNV